MLNSGGIKLSTCQNPDTETMGCVDTGLVLLHHVVGTPFLRSLDAGFFQGTTTRFNSTISSSCLSVNQGAKQAAQLACGYIHIPLYGTPSHFS
jgi:hypothetical protein